MTPLERLAETPKPKLLDLLELIPQRYWPPRPTRQDVETLRRSIARALQTQDGLRAKAWLKARDHDAA